MSLIEYIPLVGVSPTTGELSSFLFTLLQHTSRSHNTTSRSYNIRHAPTTLRHAPTTLRHAPTTYVTLLQHYFTLLRHSITLLRHYVTPTKLRHAALKHYTLPQHYVTLLQHYVTLLQHYATLLHYVTLLRNHTNVPLVRTTAFPYTHHRSSATPLSQTYSVFLQSFFTQYSLLLFYHSHIPTLASLFFSFHHTCKRTHCTGVQIRVIKEFSTSSNS